MSECSSESYNTQIDYPKGLCASKSLPKPENIRIVVNEVEGGTKRKRVVV